MRVLAWAVRLALFVLLLAFAARNTDPVTLRFWFDLAWQAPLVALLLAFFVAGAVFGLLAMLGTHIAQRREIARLRREAAPEAEGGARAATQPPAAEG
jgi:lipopolysaccharide assembly protein A